MFSIFLYSAGNLKKRLHWVIAQEPVQRSGYSGGAQIFGLEVQANFGLEHCFGGRAHVFAGHLEASPAQQWVHERTLQIRAVSGKASARQDSALVKSWCFINFGHSCLSLLLFLLVATATTSTIHCHIFSYPCHVSVGSRDSSKILKCQQT